MYMISAVILTKNNQDCIQNCLKSLRWCDELIVIDDRSIDQTAAIAESNGARVIVRTLGDDFSGQRNAGLAVAKHEWVFFVDSDEIVPVSLAQEIQQAVNLKRHNGFRFARQDILFGTRLRFGETASVRLLRLAKKTSGVWHGSVHETWHVRGSVADLSTPLEHYPHPSFSEFIADINRYSTLVAKERIHKGYTVSWWQIVVYPFAKFTVNYVFRQGFRDGTPGLLMAMMMSFHSFLVRGKMFTKQL